MPRSLMAAAAALVVLPAVAQAHVTLELREAPAGSYQKIVLRVPHGCQGSPTLKLRVKLPDGASAVKVQPKPGWTVETVKAKLARPLSDGHGGQITEGVTEAVWTGRLIDEHYDEFVLRVKLPETPPADGWLYWPVVQECERGTARWIELPAAGRSPDDLEHPAPRMKLLPRR
ncbi:MAG: YcnI family protein [Thalassobaculales bacterium]